MPSTKIKKSDIHQWEIYTVVPKFPGKKVEPGGTKGLYKVIFTLSNSQDIFVENIAPATKEDGKTFIQIYFPENLTDKTATNLKIQTQQGIVYSLGCNSKGVASIIETEEFKAESFREATSIAYNNISPYLSQLSFVTDSPISFSKIDITEISTGSARFICLPGPKKVIYPFTTMPNEINDDVAKLLAEYREAKNASTLPIYQLFCYFKIIDGYMSIKSEMVKRGQAPPILVERIENGPYKNKRFSWFRKKLIDDFRNSFAHFSYGGTKTTLSADNMDNIYSAFELMPTAHSIARKIIENLIYPNEN